MTDSLREDLLGYLLGALDEEQQAEVERRLTEDPGARRRLAACQRALAPLDAARTDYEPPDGLATRTCRFVLGRRGVGPSRYPARAAALVGTVQRPMPARMHPVALPGTAEGGFHWHDLVMAAGVIVAASFLLFPAIHGSRVQARLLACQDNLRELGASLTRYSEYHEGFFPEVPTQGKLAAASVYAPILAANKLLDEDRLVVCPGSAATEIGSFEIPTLEQIEAVDSPEALAALQETMGGSYGYSLGYQDAGQYHPTRNLRRASFAIASDAPSKRLPSHLSENHGRLGQNVLFEDGHVRFTVSPQAAELGGDDFFVNDEGFVAAGVGVSDAVIAAGATPPIVYVER